MLLVFMIGLLPVTLLKDVKILSGSPQRSSNPMGRNRRIKRSQEAQSNGQLGDTSNLYFIEKIKKATKLCIKTKEERHNSLMLSQIVKTIRISRGRKQRWRKLRQMNKNRKRLRKSHKSRSKNRFCPRRKLQSNTQTLTISYCLCKQFTYLDHLEADRNLKRLRRKKSFGAALLKRSHTISNVHQEDGFHGEHCLILARALLPQCFMRALAKRIPAGIRLTRSE